MPIKLVKALYLKCQTMEEASNVWENRNLSEWIPVSASHLLTNPLDIRIARTLILIRHCFMSLASRLSCLRGYNGLNASFRHVIGTISSMCRGGDTQFLSHPSTFLCLNPPSDAAIVHNALLHQIVYLLCFYVFGAVSGCSRSKCDHRIIPKLCHQLVH